jgi:cysteine desulfurase
LEGGNFLIYFDNAATTETLGNPASPHGHGINAERILNAASERLASLIGCHVDEIIYTSGATESNNIALLGVAKALGRKGGTVLTTPYEHPSVLEPLLHINDIGNFSVIKAPVNLWNNYLSKDCVIACCTQVCHETGDVNKIESIVKLVKQANPQIILHVDGAQGFGKETDLPEGVDLYSFSSHKFHGPPGMGGLIVKRGIPLKPIMYGGGQQNSLRPGSVNLRGILGMVDAAVESYTEIVNRGNHVRQIKEILMQIINEIPDAYINAIASDVSPYILNISFLGIKGETLVHSLSEKGIYASMGSACSSKKNDIHPLMHMGYNRERAESAVRFSFSHLNTTEEAETAKQTIISCVMALREVKRYGK